MHETLPWANYFAPPSVPLLEHWKPAVGLEGYYEVSNVGNFRRIHKYHNRINRLLAANPGSSGYLQLCPSIKNRVITKRIHDMVSEAFLGPKPDGYTVNHKNLWKRKNWASNLEYMTQEDNNAHANAGGRLRCGEGCHQAKLNAEKVRQIRRLAGTMSAPKIGELFGVKQMAILNVINRKTWKHVA